jgi:hypothetical protein
MCELDGDFILNVGKYTAFITSGEAGVMAYVMSDTDLTYQNFPNEDTAKEWCEILIVVALQWDIFEIQEDIRDLIFQLLS